MRLEEIFHIPTTQGLTISHHALGFRTGIAPLQNFSRALGAWHEPLVLPACRTWVQEICKQSASNINQSPSEKGRPNMAWVHPGKAAAELLVQP